jgi:hypothetical protein
MASFLSSGASHHGDFETGRNVLVMAIKLVHHNGEDRKPRP